jgi:hypothetical protein
MIYPTMSVMTYGIFLLAILLVADWYVWRLAYTAKLRRSQPVTPQGNGHPVETEAPVVMMAGDSAHDNGHGFKRVA